MKLLLRGKKRGLSLSSCAHASGGTDKILPPRRAPEHMDPHGRGMNPLPCPTTVQHQHRSEEKCIQKRLLCFFIPQYPSLLHFIAQSQSWKQPSAVHALHHLTTTASYRGLHPCRAASLKEDGRGREEAS